MFESNSAVSFGGGLHSYGGFVGFPGTTTVANCTFHGNTVTSGSGTGGGIDLYVTTATISNTTVDHNSSGYGGGMFLVLRRRSRTACLATIRPSTTAERSTTPAS